jgi:phospholipid-binding lipoprotein MlaA
MRRGIVRSGALLLALVLAGCATSRPSGGAAPNPRDPWENWNRKVYAFNDALDTAVLKPVATVYADIVPQPVRRGFDNFVGNFADAWSSANSFMQGKLEPGFRGVIRVSMNTVFGLGGVLDIASEAGIDRVDEDFGQTLGVWGFGPGPYIVWPLIGPSTLRDSFAFPVDFNMTPALAFHNGDVKYALTAWQIVNRRANLLAASRLLDDIALDPYTFMRDGYLQRRRSLIYDGDPPDEPDDEPEDEPAGAAAAAAPASSPASAPAK